MFEQLKDYRSQDNEKIDVFIQYEKTITDKTLTSVQVNEGLTSQQASGATAAHEAEHATNQQNINDTVDNTNLAEGQEKHDVESLPNSIGNQAREEARMKPIAPKEVSRVSN